jgi:enoyl-CoA hydratase/carnithine racemase
MQQAYQALRVVSEAQTIHVILATQPGELMLTELQASCASLRASSDGIKAVILDFAAPAGSESARLPGASGLLAGVCESLRAVPQPVLAIVRADLSEIACRLCAEADFTLVAHEAEICWPARGEDNARGNVDNRIGGLAAVRLGYATWAAPARDLDREAERILNMLRAKSAVALRLAKAGVRMGQQSTGTSLETLHQVNQLYLEKVMATEDAREGLQAFLEKRQPRWNNR